MISTEYQYASGKPERLLINYNTVRAAELKAIHASLVSDKQAADIVAEFAQESDENVRDCIDFLHAVDLLERGGDDRVVVPLNRGVLPSLPFEARLLYHLRQQRLPRNHLTRIQSVALDTADRSISLDVLLPEVKNELDIYDFSWNETKLRMWRSLSTQLGLVSQTESRGVILSPCRRLLYDLLELYEQKGDSDTLYDALSWIEENFFDVFETETGTPKVHPAVSDVLQNMEEEDVITISGWADASNTVSLPESVHKQRSRTVRDYELSQRPESPAYQYPLSQFDQVIHQ